MSEISKFEAYKKKLQGVCDENNLTFRLRKEQYPITLTIRPVQGVSEQLSLLADADDSAGYISADAYLVFSMADGELSSKTSGTFTISEALFNKLRALFKNLHATWLQYFFRDIMERRLLPYAMLPRMDTEEDRPTPSMVDDLPDDEEDEDEDDDGISFEEFLVKEATAYVRAENKAAASMLQRRFNIGYAKAARLMDELERIGVIGAYNGAAPREVLPFVVAKEEGGELNG